jgi:hypothetical protein
MGTDDNSPSKDELLAEIKEAQSEINRLREQCSGTALGFAKARVGPLAEEMARNPTVLHGYLKHPSADIRQAALAIINESHADLSVYVESAKELILRDPDLHVRWAAFHLLGKCFDGSRDAGIGSFLAQIVLDAAQGPFVRLQAYKGLIYLEDLSVDWVPAVDDLRFPDDIDWAFVHRFVHTDQSE